MHIGDGGVYVKERRSSNGATHFGNKKCIKRWNMNLNEIRRRLTEYQAWAQVPVDSELVNIARQNTQKLNTVMQAVWAKEEQLRSFSPLAKGFLRPNELVFVGQQFCKGEREYIKLFARLLHKQYGRPVFKYSGYNDTIPAVKQFQALSRISPKVTVGASLRRYENLQKYFSPSIFNPEWEVFEQAVGLARKLMNLPRVVVNFEPKYVRGLFAAHASNVGYPYFSNELTKADSTTYREIVVNKAKEMLAKHKSAKWIVPIPAMIIGRDQPGGNTLDLDREYKDLDELLAAIDKIEYKPSKARVVWAVSRLTNSVVVPVLKATLDHEDFKKNPQFCGFRSREDRYDYYSRYHKMLKETGLIPVNVDFSSFDTTISPELLLVAMDLCLEKTDCKDAPADLLDSIRAASIYTHALVLDPKTKSYVTRLKSKAISSGFGYTGLSGYACALIVMMYAYIKIYGYDWVVTTMDKFLARDTFFSAGLGDDFLGVVKDLTDLKKIADIVMKDFGMEISIDSIKTAVGIDFLQELFWEDRIEYPVARIAPSALYTERSSGKGFALWDMSYASMLYNIKGNPGESLFDATAILMSLDATDLGLKNIDGKAITEQQFMEYVKRECSARGASPKAVLWDGDPAKENKFDDVGNLKSDYLNWWFTLIRAVRNAKGRDFDVESLRRDWAR